jgi:hypothetical protein
MDIQASKLELFKMIYNIEDQNIINNLIKIVRNSQKDFWLELSESQREEIKTGINQLDSGQRISLEDFLKKVS